MARGKKRNYKITQELESRYLSMRVHRAIKNAGIEGSNLSVSRVSARKFHDAISRGKAANSKGWMVDVHSVDEYKGMKCYLTSDGKSGVAVKRNGDVVSLFSSGGGKKMGKLLPYAIAAGGRKLDCFGDGLQDMYARYGARATGQTKFDDEYKPDGWKESDGRPPVVAMILPSSLEEMVKKYDKNAHVNLGRVRTFRNYGRMITNRNSVMERERRTSRLASGLAAG